MKDALATVICLSVLLAVPARAAEDARPYAGLETREIKALSARDVAGLRAGEGMGYALAAELNGYPGPAHVLEHAGALALTDEQRERTRAVHAAMRADAVRLGEELIAAERALDRAFRERTVDAAGLSALTARVAAAEAALRARHLAAHLEMVAILSPAQVERYRVLRGYADGAHRQDGDGHGGHGHGGHGHGGHGHRQDGG